MARVYEDLDPAYAATCSDVTLCSNSRGFFKGLVEEVVSIAEATGWMERFEKLEEGGKVAAVLGNEEIMSLLSEVLSRVQPLRRGKDARVSHERRAQAAAALREGDLTKAMELASQAVLRAPMSGADEVIDGGVSLALALWLRSDVLLQAGKPQAALEDLKLALKERLPAKMRSQYYWRMGNCYRGAGEPTRAKVSYELAARLLGTNEVAKTELNKDLESLDYSVKAKIMPQRQGVSLTGGGKQNMPALSKLLRIVEEEQKGRFAVADSPVKTGDVLLVDNPFAACLLSDNFGSHCLHCFKRLVDLENEAPVWCPTCSGVAFCSITCRDAAMQYHTYECLFLDLFIGSGMSILSHIALRMVTQAGLETSLSIHSKYFSNEMKIIEGANLNDVEGTAKKTKIKTRKERLNRSKKGLKIFNDKGEENGPRAEEDCKMSFEEKLELKAAQIYSLCTHAHIRKGDDYLKRIVMAMFLTECLKKGGFFQKSDPDNLDKAQTSIIELIVRNLQILQFNAHEVYETLRQPDRQVQGSKPLYIAVGIYPTGALFNHECYPAVTRYFDGPRIVLRATRPLSPGEVVSENYGPHFLTRSLKERQRALSCRYWFRCDCRACREDWPLLKQMPADDLPYLRCPNMSCTWKFKANLKNLPSKCGKCSNSIDQQLVGAQLETINKCTDLFQKGAKLIEDEQPAEAVTVMCQGIDLIHEVARPPHRETHIAQESLRSCFAIDGNVHIVSDKKQHEKSVGPR